MAGASGVPDPPLDADGLPALPEVEGSWLPPSIAPAVEAVPGLIRVAAHAGLHTAQWSARTSLRTSLRLARALRDPEEAADLVREATQAAATLAGLARSISEGTPLPRALLDAGTTLDPGDQGDLVDRGGDQGEGQGEVTLRQRGAELLNRSRDVWDVDRSHPAYGRILGELAPDEARVLVLLLEHGPQPSVDVRTGGPIGMISSQLVAPGLTMIAARAGCRYVDQVPSYLNNLFRLGLVWFSRESLRETTPYQVLEAQPDVVAAMHSVKFAKVVRRSIHLTPFGEDFCRTCLIDEQAVTAPFPQHAAPPETESGSPPSQA